MRKSFQKALEEAYEGGGHEALDRLEKMKPGDSTEYAARGRLLASANHYHAALEDFNAAISGNRKDPQAYFGLGGTLSALGRHEEAIGALQKTVRLLPGAARAVYALCWELERSGRYDEAMEELRQYAKYDNLHNYSIYRHWGRICGKQKKWKSAYTSYAKSVYLNPPDKKQKTNDAMVQKYRQITDIRRRAAKMDPEDAHSFVVLGQELYEAGWIDEAIDVTGTAALMRPHVNLYLAIGEMYEAQFMLTEAIDAYKEGIKSLSGTVRPANLAPLYEIMVVDLFKCGRIQEVKLYGKEALSIGANGPEFLKYYHGAMEHPGPSLDMISAGWTTPPYAGTPIILDEYSQPATPVTLPE